MQWIKYARECLKKDTCMYNMTKYQDGENLVMNDEIKASEQFEQTGLDSGSNLVRGQQDNIYRQRKEQQEKKKYRKGVFRGCIVGVLVTLVVLLAVVTSFIQAGYIHISNGGEVYVQDLPVTDTVGIGEAVAPKLDALDQVLDSFYFDNADEQTIKDAIYKGYLQSFGDKYTVYYTADEYAKLLESTNGSFYGIGALCQKQEDGSIKLTEIYEDSPSEKAGLQKGDLVVQVNGRDIREIDLNSAVTMIKGEKGTSVLLTIVRDNQTMDYTVTRDEIKIKTVAGQMLEDGIGYIRISEFDRVTDEQFHNTLDELKQQGMTGLIVDIRSNPGGVLGTVVNILDEVLPEGMIVYTEDKNGKRTEYKGSNPEQIQVPMAVLVDENSASASEIFAGAVQDYGVAKIIGTQTFGKGIVQSIRPLTDGSAIKYTIAKYFTAKGQDIHGHGVTPDEVVELTPNEDGIIETDSQLQAALDYLKN